MVIERKVWNRDSKLENMNECKSVIELNTLYSKIRKKQIVFPRLFVSLFKIEVP